MHRAYQLLGRKVMEWIWLKDFLRHKDQPSQIKFPESYIKLPLAIYFTYDNVYVSMLFYQVYFSFLTTRNMES